MNGEQFRAVAMEEVKSRPQLWAIVFAAKVAFWLAWILATTYLLCGTTDVVTTVLLEFALGAAFAHGVELQHQALHRSGFHSDGLNKLTGFILGLPMLVSYSSYQDSHLFHHSRLGTNDDVEFFEYGENDHRKFGALFNRFFLINHFSNFVKTFADAAMGRPIATRLFEKSVEKIRMEYLIMGGIFFGAALGGVLLGSSTFFICWLVPLFIFAAPIHALIELPEHFECDKTSPDVFRNTRSVKSNAFATWFTNGNNYHVEHHWLSSLPPEKLVNVHRQIRGGILHLSPSYYSFFSHFARATFRKAGSHRSPK